MATPEEGDERELDRIRLSFERRFHCASKFLQHGRCLARNGDRRRHWPGC
jgi:hypothetical protein